MTATALESILALPVPERIRLVELIWDSITATPEAIALPPETKTELENRLAEFKAAPEAGYTWEEVRASLKDGSWRTA